MKKQWIGFTAGLLSGLAATTARADDIDIYAGRVAASTRPVRIMLSLDLRQGAAGPTCDDAGSVRCSAELGERLYAQLDLYGINRNSAGDLTVEPGADGAPDREQPDPHAPARSLAQNHWPGRQVSFADTLRAALRSALTRASVAASASPGRLEVGLMGHHADDCDGAGPTFVPDYSVTPARACSQGAYVLKGFTDISVPGNLEHLLLKLAAIPDPAVTEPWMGAAWAGHTYRIRDIYFELFRYLSGQRVFSGFLGASDYGSQTSGNLYHDHSGRISNDVVLNLPDGTGNQPLLAPDPTTMAAASLDLANNRVGEASYLSPLSLEEECPALYLVNILAGSVSPSHEAVTAAIAAPRDEGGLGLRLPAGQAGDTALIAAMAGAGGAPPAAPLRSYFFVRDTDAAVTAMAAAGKTGQAVAMTGPRQLLLQLDRVFSDVFNVATTLVAGSTPVDLSDRNRGHGDIYFAMFEAGPGPLWRGNVKKLKFALLAEADGDSGNNGARGIIAQAPLSRPPRPAMSSQDGRIMRDALTFWTDPGGADVLAFNPALGEVSGRDGRSTSRGGAGQQIVGFLGNTVGSGNGEAGARQVYTLDPSARDRLLALDATATVRAALSPYLDPADRMGDDDELRLLRWIRGEDAFDSDGDNDLFESRPWLLGDVMHSRPLAVNYGVRPGTSYSRSNPEIRLFFGSNDGFFHALTNTSDHGADPESGRETWAFIPPAMLAMQATLAGITPHAPAGHPYGMDGEAVALIDDLDGDGNIESADGDRVWVVIGQRRGGTGLYAFDVTDPDSPQFKWMIDNRTPGFEQLALSFSTPRHARLDLGDGSPTSALVFAGGYNGGWRGAGRIGKDAGDASDTVGNAIFVVAAGDGSLIWKAVGPGGNGVPGESDQLHFAPAMTHSMPAPVAVVDSDGNGIDDRAYVGDSGGNVWRVELTESESGQADTGARNWFVSRMASLGGSGVADRRFFHAPDTVHVRDSSGVYHGLLLVSGNRAAPQETITSNFAYLLKDRAHGSEVMTGAATAVSHDELIDITEVCASPGASACAPRDLAKGWKLELQSAGEKGVSTPLVSNGIVMFTSYLPPGTGADEPCVPGEGSGRVYAVQLADGAPGLPPPGGLDLLEGAARYQPLGPGIPGAVVPYGDRLLIPGRGIGGGQLVDVPGERRWPVYWREEEVDLF